MLVSGLTVELFTADDRDCGGCDRGDHYYGVGGGYNGAGVIGGDNGVVVLVSEMVMVVHVDIGDGGGQLCSGVHLLGGTVRVDVGDDGWWF